MLPYLNWEFQLIIKLSDKQVMREDFPHLHDSDDSSIYLVLSVLEDPLFGLLLFFTLSGKDNNQLQIFNTIIPL